MHVFTYGSLMFEPVWSLVVRGRYQASSARLSGYQRRVVIGQTYPGLWPGKADCNIEGVLYHNVTDADVGRLDRFEGRYYQRRTLSCVSNGERVEAAVYVFRPQFGRLLGNRCWDPVQFAQRGLPRFLARYRGFAETE